MLNVSIKTAYSAALDTPFIAVLQLQESDKPMGPGGRCVLAGVCVRGQGVPSQLQLQESDTHMWRGGQLGRKRRAGAQQPGPCT